MPFPAAGLYRMSAEQKSSSGGSCNFDGATTTWTLTKIDSEQDALNWTVVEDRESQKCGEPVKRFTRVETAIYKVVCFCFLRPLCCMTYAVVPAFYQASTAISKLQMGCLRRC